MRTYTRKKPEYQLIEGVQELCRLCLGKFTASVKIFSDDSRTDVCGPLSLRIMICVGLEVTREDCLPNEVCLDCYKELEKYYMFRKKCEIAYQKLKSHVLAVKEREQQKVVEKKEIIYEPERIVIEDSGLQEESVQHLVLFNEGKQPPELFDVINGIQLGNTEELNGFTNGTVRQISIENEQSSEMQVQDISSATKSESTLEVDTSNLPVSTILSSILFELGLLQQQEGGLVIVDENLKTVELEGEDNSKVILEIVEEDEDGDTLNESEELEEINSTEKLNVIAAENNYHVKQPLSKPIFKIMDSKVKEIDDRWCLTCGKRFASRSVLARHQRVHSGERPFACGTCGKRFAQREVMTRHELVHSAKRPFACDQCPKSFTQRGALAAHARLHGPRALALHRCGFCSKVFLYASGLSRHMTVHSGKVFVCNTCGRHFSDKSSLLRHLRKSHRTAESPPPPGAPTNNQDSTSTGAGAPTNDQDNTSTIVVDGVNNVVKTE